MNPVVCYYENTMQQKRYAVKQILIIDDDPNVRSVIRRTMQRAGYATEEASHGKEALRTIEEKAIDVAIVDIIMPEKGGIETLMEIKKKHPNIKTIIISGKVDTQADSFRTLVTQFGSTKILEKPFEMDELKEAVGNALSS